ncbi:MAG: radical SAM protein [Candidatus Altiarchaeales archaeon]|nr:radical SAM protein [Candidatus Altiarchaeales archaeon]
MKDIVLINPPYQKTSWERSYSPLGLPYIASNLEDKGHSVGIVDSDVEGLDVEGVVSVVARENPKVVGISVLTHALPKVCHIIEGIREISNCEIIVGGAHITADPEMVRNLGVKYGIRGEAEYSFLNVVDHILGNTSSLEGAEGLVLNENNILRVKNPCFIDDINKLPRPARHLIGTGRYRYTCVFSSRGCPYECIYCAEQCKRVRFREPESVVEEVEELVKGYGVREFEFGDSVFTLNHAHVLEMCELLKKKNLRVRWSCITRADLVDGSLLRTMRDSGCRFVSFGVESGVEEIRFRGGKEITDDKIREVFKQCREFGLKTRASILFGSPGETLGDMRKSIEFARELKPDYALFSVTQLLPGTRLFKQALAEGKVDKNIWLDYMQGKRTSLDYLPDGITLEDLYRVNVEAFNRFYLDGGYIRGKISGVSSLVELKEALFILLAKANVIPVGGVVEDSMHKCIE